MIYSIFYRNTKVSINYKNIDVCNSILHYFRLVQKKLDIAKAIQFSQWFNKMKQKNLNESNSTLLGYNGRKPVYCSDNAKHIFICGTTGSGKTVALSNYIENCMKKDFPMLIVDGKGDTGKGSILDVLTQLNKQYNKKIYRIDLTNPFLSDTYNPFFNTSPTIAKDMMINMTDWSEEHYKVNAERYLQRLIMMMNKAKIPLSFQSIIKFMELDNFALLSSQLVKSKTISKEKHIENLEIAHTSGFS